MRKLLLSLLTILLVVTLTLGFASCTNTYKFELKFIVDGELYETIKTNGNEAIEMPQNPTKDGCVFDGWYWDNGTWEKPFTVNSLLDAPLSSDMNVYAKWTDNGKHRDTNDDSICDNCGEKYNDGNDNKNNCQHKDKNDDLLCDKCGIVYNDGDECNHKDKNDDLLCDKCGTTYDDGDECNHKDKNGDLICDKCGKSLNDGNEENPQCQHRDADDNSLCDKCGEDYTDGKDVEEHIHNYNQQNTDSDYLATPADCENSATYYYSCSCGEKGTATFTYGEANDGHKYESSFVAPTATEDGHTYHVCSACGSSYKDSYVTPVDFTVTYDNREDIGYTGEEGENLVIPAVFEKDGVWYRVTGIGDMAFIRCYNLRSVTIPVSVISMGNASFNDCTGLVNITVDTNNPNYKAIDGNLYSKDGKILIHYCTGKTEERFIIPDGVTSISEYAFYMCRLVSLTIPESLTSIGNYAFNACYKLAEIINKSSLSIVKGSSAYIHGGVATYALVVHNGESRVVNKNGYLFMTYGEVNYLLGYEGNQTELALPSSYNGESYQIYERAFWKHPTITSVTIENGVTSINRMAFWECSKLERVVVGNSVTSIGEEALRDCNTLTSVTIGDGVANIAPTAFVNSESITYITVDTNNANYKSVDGNLYSKDGTTLVMYAVGKTDADFTIPDGVTDIGNYAFRMCSSLTSIVIPSGVTVIGEWAFSDCENLVQIYYGGTREQWNKIEKGEYWNISTEDCEITYNYTDGSHTHNYNQTNISSTYLATSADCENAAEYYYSCSCGEKGAETFTCGEPTEHNYVSGTCTVCGDAQGYSEGLEFVLNSNGTYSVSGIGDCSDSDVVIPSTYEGLPVTSIVYGAFLECYSVKSITIPDSVISIESFALEGCYELATITVDANNPSYKSIDGNLYSKDGKTLILYAVGKEDTSFIIPNGVSTINSRAFYYGTSLTNVVISDSVETIKSDAFTFCLNLKSVTIGSGVKSIASAAFCECVNLAEIIYCGTEAQWNAINKDDYWDMYAGDCVGGYTITYFTPEEPSTEGVVYQLSVDGTYATVTGYEGASSDVVIAREYQGVPVTKIAFSAFAFNFNITSVVIPDSVTVIGDSAFWECYNLVSVTIPDSVTVIESYAFLKCVSLASVTIPENVVSIGDKAFYACYTLVEVINKSAIDITKGSNENGYVGYYALKVHSGESEIVNIGDYVFYTSEDVNYLLACRNLDENIVLPDSFNGQNYEIYKHAFDSSYHLTSVVIPQSVTAIGASAFYEVDGLQHIKYRGTEEQWAAIRKDNGWNNFLGGYTLTCNYTGE